MAGSQRPLESLPGSRELGVKSHPEPIYVVVCGAENVGKTALITRVSLTIFTSPSHMALSGHGHLISSRLHQQYCINYFVTGYDPFQEQWRAQRTFNETPYVLDFIEVPGSWVLDEKRSALNEPLKRMDALLFTYDVGDRGSFEKMKDIYETVLATAGESLNVPVGIVATKSDTPKEKWQVEAQEGGQFASMIGGVFVACSAKEGEGVEDAVERPVLVAVEGKAKLLREREERHQARMRMYKERA